MRNKSNTSFFILVVSVAFLASGCSVMKRANKAFERGQYEKAIDLYEKMATNSKHGAEANFQIGECYRLSNRTRQALPFYQQAIERDYYDEAASFYMAFALKANEEYQKAQDQLDSYLEAANNFEYIEYAQRESNNLDLVNELLGTDSYYRVKNLEAINTAFAEYSPVYQKGELFFVSNRGGGKLYEATGTPRTDIFKVTINGARPDLETLAALEELFNDPEVNEGSVTFSPDGNTMVFAKGTRGGRKGAGQINLFEARRNRRGTWSKPRMIRASDPDAWDSSPSFSSDGRTLYFASNRENGYGGTDIYSSSRNGRGRWGSVRNMGNKINTPGNEMFPYAAPDGKLYFSSTGHPGLGGLDIFVAERERGAISIKNLGVPVNSSADDFGMYLFNPSRGFLSSNREGGKGDDDIYTFVNNDPDLKIVNYFLAGTTYEPEKNEAGEVTGKTILSGVHIKLLGADGAILEEAYTGDDGEFQFRVYPEEDYVLIADKEKYFTTRSDFSTIGRTVDKSTLTEMVTNKTFNTEMILDPLFIGERIVLENIYYEFNSAKIGDEAALELDKLVEILEDNPQIRIELSSHTDSVGTDSYNLQLSQRRAESAVSYILENGIDPDRIVARGYGESRPIARNTNPDGTDNVEGRARNRRTEFEIIDIIERAKPESEETDEEEAEEGFDEDRYFNGG